VWQFRMACDRPWVAGLRRLALVVTVALGATGCVVGGAASPNTSPASSGDGSSCALPAYPRPDCTGAPSGLQLRELPVDADGNVVLDVPGTVLDGVHIAGSLLVKAPDSVIRNSVIDGTVYNDINGVVNSYSIFDSTVGPEHGCIEQPGLNESNYTAERVRIRGHDDGFRMSGSGKVTVRDSFAQLCYLEPAQAPPDGSHSDGIQAYCPTSPCADLLFEHNTVDARGIPATFIINLEDQNVTGDVRVLNNLLAGGAYTIVTKWRDGPMWQVRGNGVIDGSWAYGAQSAEGTCAHQDWADNSIVDVDGDYRVSSIVSPLPCKA
jgi:hypothetical protein